MAVRTVVGTARRTCVLRLLYVSWSIFHFITFFIMMLHYVIAFIYLRMRDILRNETFFLPPVSYVD